MVDVSITCPHPLRGPNLSRAQADKPLRRANQIFDDKIRKYEEIARRNRIEFLPLIVESTGRLHPKVIEFLNLALASDGMISKLWNVSTGEKIRNLKGVRLGRVFGVVLFGREIPRQFRKGIHCNFCGMFSQ